MSDGEVRIPIGQVGRISAGEQRGWYVQVVDDAENTGGYLILTCRNADMKSGEGYNDWVEKREDLVAFFAESGWRVLWF